MKATKNKYRLSLASWKRKPATHMLEFTFQICLNPIDYTHLMHRLLSNDRQDSCQTPKKQFGKERKFIDFKQFILE